jgi:shikimate kinase
LARQLGLRFVDSDTEIERRIGMPIKDYFALHGEEAFRDQEQAVIDELTAVPELLLGHGRWRGAPAFQPRRAALANARLLPAVHARRTAPPTAPRHAPAPAAGGRPAAPLRDLYRDRDPLYRRTAHFVVEAVRPSVPALLGMVLMQLELAGLVDPSQVPSSIGGTDP